MSKLAWVILSIGAYLSWVLWGVQWLYRRKVKLIRSFPEATEDALMQLAKSGNVEAQRLRRDTWVFVAVGLVLALTLWLLRSIVRAA